MATYQRRGAAWRVQVRMRGHALSSTFDTHEEARIWATAQEAKLAEMGRGKAGTRALVTVREVLARYRDDVSPKRRGGRWEIIRLDMLARDKAFAVPLRDFGAEQMAEWRDARLKVVSPASVNRELNLLSSVFQTAIREWGHGSLANPARGIERPATTPARRRRVTDAEAAAIRERLGWDGASRPATTSQWVAWCHALAMETAMRRGEILGLTPERVDLGRAVAELPTGSTKTGHGRLVPLSSRARAILTLSQPWEAGRPLARVAPGTLDALFRRARDAAGIVDLHFHDSRREAITRAAPKLGDTLALARMSGHRDPRQLLDYFRPDMTDLAKKLD
jgi:integrase